MGFNGIYIYTILVGGDWNHGIFNDFPFSWEFHNPNWWTPSFFRGVGIPPTNPLYSLLVSKVQKEQERSPDRNSAGACGPHLVLSYNFGLREPCPHQRRAGFGWGGSRGPIPMQRRRAVCLHGWIHGRECRFEGGSWTETQPRDGWWLASADKSPSKYDKWRSWHRILRSPCTG